MWGCMKTPDPQTPVEGTRCTAGKIGYVFLWLLGVPLPIVLLLYACHGG